MLTVADYTDADGILRLICTESSWGKDLRLQTKSGQTRERTDRIGDQHGGPVFGNSIPNSNLSFWVFLVEKRKASLGDKLALETREPKRRGIAGFFLNATKS